MRIELTAELEKPGPRTKNDLTTEFNKLIIWIIATMLASGALFITLAKVFFDK